MASGSPRHLVSARRTVRNGVRKARSRLGGRNRSSHLGSPESRFDRLEAAQQEAVDATSAVARELAELRALIDERTRRIPQELERVKAILQVIFDREPESRERLRALRESAEYERAFTEVNPLVSIPIATYDRGDLLVSRAIPSVLAQTYKNLEIVVVGDSAPSETADRIAALGDPRVRYTNMPYRGPYPEDPRDGWHVHGIPPRNEAVLRSRGRWIAPLDDDDAFHPDHVRTLLAIAQERRLEVAYGLLRCLMNDGSEFNLGGFPPTLGHFGWQGAIFHAGLQFFEMELATWLFFTPADWYLCRRMLRAGVRFGMLDEVVTDHYESRIDPQYESTPGA